MWSFTPTSPSTTFLPCRKGDADGLIDPAQFLDSHAQGSERSGLWVGAAPELFRHDQAKEPQVPHGGYQVHREVMVTIPGGDVRRDLPLGEVAHHGPEVLVVLAQFEHDHSRVLGPS